MSRLNGSSASKPGDQTPEQNGADGRAAAGEMDEMDDEEAAA